jgi:hypothetical protein
MLVFWMEHHLGMEFPDRRGKGQEHRMFVINSYMQKLRSRFSR